MRRNQKLLLATTALMTLGMLTASQQFQVAADAANAPSLVISQLKITSSNGQFITLHNTTSSVLNMSKYQLQYFNHYDLTKATSSKLIALSGMVPPHGYYMVSDGSVRLCYQLTIDSMSLGLSSTAGFVQVLEFNQTTAGASIVPSLEDYVGWSKTVSFGAQTLPSNTAAFLERLPLDAKNNPSITAPGLGTWRTLQPSASSACSLTTVTGTAVTSSTDGLLLPSEPPSTIIGQSENSTAITDGSMTAVNIGLMSPQITELLPNPSGTGNDSIEEYIELYNSNEVSFNLAGYALQSGASSTRNYLFPAGTSLPARSFTTFYSKTTGLSLSNTGGLVKLLDPILNSISATDTYTTAKDGQTWALAKGKWYWTTTPTPNAANIIKQPILSKQAKAAVAKTSKTAAKAKSLKPTKTPKITTTSAAEEPPTTPIHTWTLALVGGLALLYGAYEYRNDLANRIYQFREHLRTRRTGRT